MVFSTLHDVLAGPHDPRIDALTLTGSGSHLSRSALYTCVTEFALALQQAGIRPGDVVSMAYVNTVRHRNHSHSHHLHSARAYLLPLILASKSSSLLLAFRNPPPCMHRHDLAG